MSVTLIECVASEVIADDAEPGETERTCPACGALVRLGGTPTEPRYAIHNLTSSGWLKPPDSNRYPEEATS